MQPLKLTAELGLTVVSCGLFVSSNSGTHLDRVLDNNELIVVRTGTLSIWEEDVRYDVPAGHALLLEAGRRHRGAAPFAKDLSFYWIHFVSEAGGAARGSELELPKFTRVQRPDCVAEVFHRYLDDQEARRLDPFYAGLLLWQILCEVSRKEPTARDARGASIAGRAEAYVTRHLTEPLSTARIARALRVNPDYLNRAFRKLHQLTLTEYIHRRRLNDATSLLRDTTQSVEEIAAACGYRSVAHFRRMFQRVRGVSPAAYRGLMARAYVNTR